jgi:hypothetical protein
MSELSPLSGVKRKSVSANSTSVFDPNRPWSTRVHCDAANTFRVRAISIPGCGLHDLRNAPVTGDVLLPVGIFELACDHW